MLLSPFVFPVAEAALAHIKLSPRYLTAGGIIINLLLLRVCLN
jgi:hypothetical protein